MNKPDDCTMAANNPRHCPDCGYSVELCDCGPADAIMPSADRVREMAEAHWGYTEGVARAAGKEVDELHAYLYVQAFRHGYKHAAEELSQKLDTTGD